MAWRHFLCLCGAFVGFATFGAAAYETVAGGIVRLEDAWVRESPIGGRSGGGYLRITNTGNEPDRLVRAESPSARRIEVRQATYEGDTLKVRTMEKGLVIPAGATVRLRWESYHLMFLDLKEPFKEDETIDVTLYFEKSGKITAPFEVKPRMYWY